MWQFYIIFVFERYSKIGMNKQILGRILALTGMVSPWVGQAQQDPMFTHFTYNKLFYNPAYAGASGQYCLNAITHQQWLGFDDQTSYLRTQNGDPIMMDLEKMQTSIAPRTGGLGFSAPAIYKDKNYGGATFSYVSDKIGYETTTFMKGGIALAYPMLDGSNIRLGVDFASMSKSLNGAGLRAHDPGDPMIPNGNVSDNRTTLGLGAYYTTPNIMDGAYAGLSVTNMTPQTFMYGLISTQTKRHYYLVAGYKQESFLGNPSLVLEPAILVKAASNAGFIKPQIDLQGMVTWNDLFAGGANFRAYGTGVESFSLMFGYYPPLMGNGAGSTQRLRVGYSYDIPMNNLIRSQSGTHEIQVNYCFTFTLPERPVKVYRHPRWMERSPEFD